MNHRDPSHFSQSRPPATKGTSVRPWDVLHPTPVKARWNREQTRQPTCRFCQEWGDLTRLKRRWISCLKNCFGFQSCIVHFWGALGKVVGDSWIYGIDSWFLRIAASNGIWEDRKQWMVSPLTSWSWLNGIDNFMLLDIAYSYVAGVPIQRTSLEKQTSTIQNLTKSGDSLQQFQHKIATYRVTSFLISRVTHQISPIWSKFIWSCLGVARRHIKSIRRLP